MKHFLLILSFLLIITSGYSQSFSGNSAGWNINSSVENEKNLPELKIFPNPCKDKKVTIEMYSDLLSEIRLVNIAGQEVYLKKLEIPVNRVQFELISVPNGIYMVQVKTQDNKFVVKKLLVAGK